MDWIAAIAGIALGAAFVFLAAFFATKDERLDRLAEWAFVLFAVTAIPTIVTVASHLTTDGPVVALVTAIGVIGVAILGLGELGANRRLIDFRRIAPAIALAFLAFLVWIGVISLLIVIDGGFPAGLGWLGLASIVSGVAIMAVILGTPGVLAGTREPGRGQVVAFFVPMVGMVTWMLWLAVSLGSL